MWTSNFIPFQEKLRQKIDSYLENAGFEYSEETIERKIKAVVYSKRYEPTEQILFYAMMAGDYHPESGTLDFNWLRVQVTKPGSLINVVPSSLVSTPQNV
jgi:hypothetical protein